MANGNGNRALMVIVLVLILNLTFRLTPPSISTKHSEAIIASQRRSLSSLNNSSWGSFSPTPADGEEAGWLNLTGFRESDGYAWTLLPAVKQKALEQLRYFNGQEGVDIIEGISNKSILQYQNATAWLRGRWLRDTSTDHVQIPKVNLSAIAPGVKFVDRYERNMTGKGGKIQVKIEESSDKTMTGLNGTAQGISAVFTIQDKSSVGDGWEVGMSGIHFKDSATILLSTASAKFDGLSGLPHMALTHQSFVTSKDIINKTISGIIEREETSIASKRLEDTDSDSSLVVPSCEMIAYIQFRPLEFSHEFSRTADGSSTRLVSVLEDELQNPSGAPFGHTPEMGASVAIFSPDCGYILVSEGPPNHALQPGHMHGQRPEALMAQGKIVLLAFTAVLVLQLALIVKQMRDSRTPTAKSRISFYTIALFSLGKGLTWVTFMVAASVDNALYLLSTVVAFFAFLAGSFFGMKFMLDIWALQEPEREQQERQRPAGEPVVPPTSEVNDSVPAPTRATSVPTPPEGHNPQAEIVDTGASPLPTPMAAAAPPQTTAGAVTTPRTSNFGSFYVKFYLLLLVTMFVSIHASAAWPAAARNLYANLLAMAYLCIWFPQIYRNIVRNCRKALSWTFIIGQSLLNLVPIAYFWVYEDNVLYVEPDRAMFVVLAGLIWIQWLILAAQEILGPRFFVSQSWSWVPHAWDYHPILKEDEESGSLPLGLSGTTIQEDQSPSTAANGKPSERGQKIYDCTICMQNIEVPIVRQDEATTGDIIAASLNSNFLARRNYMVTPCRHIFHTACLEAWVGYRLQCPICRETLPPL